MGCYSSLRAEVLFKFFQGVGRRTMKAESELLLPESARQKERQPSPRFRFLDIFRGMAMALMLLVDNQGDFSHVYSELNEGIWNGYRACNQAFPTFLFCLGVSIPLALRKKTYSQAWPRILRRTIVLFLLGLGLNWMGRSFAFPFRFMGVLQRISLCYFAPALLYSSCKSSLGLPRLIIAASGVVYLVLMTLVPVPHCGVNNLTPECNMNAYFDGIVFGSRWKINPNDPEGLVSTLNAVLSAWGGVECGQFLVRGARNRDKGERDRYVLFRVGLVAIGSCVSAIATSFIMPVNKKIWSTPFTFATLAISAATFCLLYLLIEWGKERPLVLKLCAPLRWLGMNPILIFLGMVTLEIVMLDWVHIGSQSMWLWFYWKCFSGLPLKFASLLVSLLHALLWTAVAGLLHWRKVFLKV